MVRRWDLHRHGNRRAGLEEADRGACIGWRFIRIEPEVIERAPTNGIRILVLGKRLGAPGQSIGGLIYGPRRAAKSLVVLGAIIGERRTLRRGVKTDIVEGNAVAQGNAEHLDRA